MHLPCVGLRYALALIYYMIYSTLLYTTLYSTLYSSLLFSTLLCSALLCSTVLYCTVLYCAVLYCTVLCSTVLYCTALHCTALYCTVLYFTVEWYTIAVVKSVYGTIWLVVYELSQVTVTYRCTQETLWAFLRDSAAWHDQPVSCCKLYSVIIQHDIMYYHIL